MELSLPDASQFLGVPNRAEADNSRESILSHISETLDHMLGNQPFPLTKDNVLDLEAANFPPRSSAEPKVVDLGAANPPFPNPALRDNRRPSQNPFTPFIFEFTNKGRIRKKFEDPESCRWIAYNVRRTSPLCVWCCALVVMGIWTLICDSTRPFYNVFCDAEQTTPVPMGQMAAPKEEEEGRTIPLSQKIATLETIVGFGGALLVTQGLLCLRSSRERLERVAHTAINVAVSILKGTLPMSDRTKLQRRIFEFLALVTAYPVCLLHQMRGNTYDPSVVQICRDAALRLQKLRPIRADQYTPKGPGDPPRDYSTSADTLTETKHFFEKLSLQLDHDFRTFSTRAQPPSMAPQRVIFSIRKHLEDLIDSEDLHMGRSPIVRENIDIMAVSGRECTVFSYPDAAPLSFLWALGLTASALCFIFPIQLCAEIDRRHPIETSLKFLAIVVISATAFTVLIEVTGLWDPYGRAVNMYSWTLGIAREIDCMMDEYDSTDFNAAGRRHGYNATESVVPPGPFRRSFASESIHRLSSRDGRLEDQYPVSSESSLDGWAWDKASCCSPSDRGGGKRGEGAAG
ncbi:hypothetical protein NM208_g15411 [Fusarium decemcellulare]|uniref:Uncharacterized protein n=1 Tax=Fusarium decemcellulare TaxID=57161 RepID=A0ACC1RHB2_9HYPO|nr:hypothetical protein NM208_g15411 [Fusarium decemcellulare]